MEIAGIMYLEEGPSVYVTHICCWLLCLKQFLYAWYSEQLIFTCACCISDATLELTAFTRVTSPPPLKVGAVQCLPLPLADCAVWGKLLEASVP